MDATKSNDKRSTPPIPLSPLTEWPVYLHTSRYHQLPEVKRRGRRKLLGLGKASKSGRFHDSDNDSDNCDDRRDLLLRVLGCPLAPISVDQTCCTNDFLHNIKHIPLVRSTAQYIIQQYLAATGCLKMMSTGAHHQQPQQGYFKNMYTTGTVKMKCCETEVSSIRGQSISNSGGRSHETDNVNGCFVLWQMVPGMWSLELVLSSGNKVLAGSDGDTVWSHTPSLGKQVAKGPKRPLRRSIQGLDPKSTAMLFAKAEHIGDKKIGEEECFVLKVCATAEDLIARSYGPIPSSSPGLVLVEVLRHVLYGYFSQKSGLLVYMEDSQLTRAIVGHDHINNANSLSDDQTLEDVMYWETSIGSSIGDYKEVEGLMVAHQGRSVATVFGFPDFCLQAEQPFVYRTRFEELWNIDDIAFNIHGLSPHSFLPPSQ
ncbi:hypothetical protein R6Q57_016248 [Mikania cordata]